MSNNIPASVRIQYARAANHARSAGLLIALLLSSALPQVARAQSCGEAGGDYCNCVAAGADRRSAGLYAGAPLAALGLLALRRRRRPPASRRIERGAR